MRTMLITVIGLLVLVAVRIAVFGAPGNPCVGSVCVPFPYARLALVAALLVPAGLLFSRLRRIP